MNRNQSCIKHKVSLQKSWPTTDGKEEHNYHEIDEHGENEGQDEKVLEEIMEWFQQRNIVSGFSEDLVEEFIEKQKEECYVHCHLDDKMPIMKTKLKKLSES